MDIPHDWLIYNTNDLYETSTGWCQKEFLLPKRKRAYALLSALTEFTWTKQGVCERCFGRGVEIRLLAFMFDITDLVRDGGMLLQLVWITTAKLQVVFRIRHFQKGLALRKPWRYVSAMTAFISPRQKQEDGWQTVKAEMFGPARARLLGESASGTLFFDKNGKEVAKAAKLDVGRIFPLHT